LGIKQGQLEQTKKTISLVDLFLQKIGKSPLVIKVKTNGAGHLFASLHAKDIAEAIKKNFNLEFPADLIILDKPLKEIGETKIALKAGDSRSEFVLQVETL
jgi:ribosomal protein L9